MKATIKKPIEVEIKTLLVRAGVRYWEDTSVNGIDDEEGKLIPCRDGDYWCPKIDIDKGVITNWEKGKTAIVHYKICDDGTYDLLDEKEDCVLTKEGYVPDILDLDGESYGDYIIMTINEDGSIENWDNNPNINDFQDEEDD
jgi:hypothetical protein